MTRSPSRIAEILRELCHARLPVTAYLENGELLLMSRIRHVDADSATFLIDYGFSRPANATLMSSPRVMLHCEQDRMHVQFLAAAPEETIHEGQPAVRLAFPEYLVRHYRRAHERIRVPRQLQVKCMVDCPGFIPFELEIVDISAGGQGALLHNPDIQLKAGTVLTGCRIKHPLRPPIPVDVEICYRIGLPPADGKGSHRVGCRFIGDAGQLAALARMFTISPEKPGGKAS